MKNKSSLIYKAGFMMLMLSLPLISRAQKISFDYDSKANFSSYKTYAWLAPGDSVLNRYRTEKLYCGYITYSANKELNSRGLQMDTLKPDLIVVFNTNVQEITKYSESPTLSIGVGVAGPGYYVAGMAPVAGGKITATTQEDGVLSYDMYDTRTGKLIWTAHAGDTFLRSDDIEKIIGEVTAKIFKKFPVKKLKS
ncbi:MAG TPA: DUF4136 domain-containing protein [Ohtaekwangia sp.]